MHAPACAHVSVGRQTNDECSCVRVTAESRGSGQRMIGVCSCQSQEAPNFFLLFFSSPFAWSNGLVSDVYKPDPCAGCGGQKAARKLKVQKACENGGLGRGMGWNAAASQKSIHLRSPLQRPMFPYLGCSIIAGHHRISAGRLPRGSKGPPDGADGPRGHTWGCLFGRLRWGILTLMTILLLLQF